MEGSAGKKKLLSVTESGKTRREEEEEGGSVYRTRAFRAGRSLARLPSNSKYKRGMRECAQHVMPYGRREGKITSITLFLYPSLFPPSSPFLRSSSPQERCGVSWRRK